MWHSNGLGAASIAGVGASALAALLASACGSGESVSSGYWSGQPGGAGEGAALDAGASLAGVWPKGDPNPGSAPTGGGPSFGPPDGGAPITTGTRVSCTGKAGATGDRVLTFASAGGTRDAYIHVPASYDPTKGAMMIVSYHGYTSNAPEQILLTRLNPVADARGILAVYPDGVGAGWNAGQCCGDAWDNSVDDVQFTRDLVARIESEYCVDTARVFATGMSNGGFMSHRVGCEMSDLFAAVAPVAGTLGIDPAKCTPPRAVPLIDFHGTADPIVPYGGGTPISPVDLGSAIPITFRSVDESIGAWRAIDRCVAQPVKIFAQGDSTCTLFGDCMQGADVVQCTIQGGGHTWPGGLPIPPLGKTSADLDATGTMVDFFEAHPMPGRGISATH